MEFNILINKILLENDEFSVLSDDENDENDENDEIDNKEYEERQKKKKSIITSICKVFQLCNIDIEYEFNSSGQKIYKGIYYDTEDNTGRVKIDNFEISSEELKNLMDSGLFKSFNIIATQEKHTELDIEFVLNADIKIL